MEFLEIKGFTKGDGKGRVPVVAEPDGPIYGALQVSVSSGKGTFLQDRNIPLGVKFVSEDVPGTTVYLVKGNRSKDAEDYLEATVTFTYVDPEPPPVPPATKLNLVAGPEEQK